MQKTNRDYPFIYNNEIIEWDIKSANTSLMSYYNLQPEKVIQKLASMAKSQREIAVGKLMRKDKDFSKNLEESFNKIIQEFMDMNSLTWDDIVSVKKDAVFVKNHKITHSNFGSVHFIPKNQYKHVLLLPKYEIYLSDSKTDVKGIPDDKLSLHEEGMLDFIRNTMETASEIHKLHYFFKEYVTAYKNKDLEFDAYREFNSDSLFRIGGEFPMMTDSMIEEDMGVLDISYNYINVVLPTIQATF